MADKIMVGNEVLWDGTPYNEHLASKANPHETTKEQTGAAAALASHNTAEDAHGDIRSDLSEVSSQLADKVQVLKVKNQTINGDFRNGTASWLTTGTTGFTVTGKIAEFTCTTSGGYIRQEQSVVSGNKMFMYAKIKASSSSVKFQSYGNQLSHSGSGNYEELYSVFNAGSTVRKVNITEYSNSGWQKIYVDGSAGIYVINMTENGIDDFTSAEMLKLIKVVGYFEGEYKLSQRDSLKITLALARENRNAIIALGGTIV